MITAAAVVAFLVAVGSAFVAQSERTARETERRRLLDASVSRRAPAATSAGGRGHVVDR